MTTNDFCRTACHCNFLQLGEEEHSHRRHPRASWGWCTAQSSMHRLLPGTCSHSSVYLSRASRTTSISFINRRRLLVLNTTSSTKAVLPLRPQPRDAVCGAVAQQRSWESFSWMYRLFQKRPAASVGYVGGGGVRGEGLHCLQLACQLMLSPSEPPIEAAGRRQRCGIAEKARRDTKGQRLGLEAIPTTRFTIALALNDSKRSKQTAMHISFAQRSTAAGHCPHSRRFAIELHINHPCISLRGTSSSSGATWHKTRKKTQHARPPPPHHPQHRRPSAGSRFRCPCPPYKLRATDADHISTPETFFGVSASAAKWPEDLSMDWVLGKCSVAASRRGQALLAVTTSHYPAPHAPACRFHTASGVDGTAER